MIWVARCLRYWVLPRLLRSRQPGSSPVRVMVLEGPRLRPERVRVAAVRQRHHPLVRHQLGPHLRAPEAALRLQGPRRSQLALGMHRVVQVPVAAVEWGNGDR